MYEQLKRKPHREIRALLNCLCVVRARASENTDLFYVKQFRTLSVATQFVRRECEFRFAVVAAAVAETNEWKR